MMTVSLFINSVINKEQKPIYNGAYGFLIGCMLLMSTAT